MQFIRALAADIAQKLPCEIITSRLRKIQRSEPASIYCMAHPELYQCGTDAHFIRMRYRSIIVGVKSSIAVAPESE